MKEDKVFNEHNENKSPKDIDYYLERLTGLSARLRILSAIVILVLLADIVALGCIAPYFTMMNRYSDYSDYFIYYFIIIFISTSGIFSLLAFHGTKKRGMVYYEEIVDEIEWSSMRSDFKERPPIGIRVVIKDFLKSTDLPFTSGQNGQTLYFALFLALFFLTIALGTLVIFRY